MWRVVALVGCAACRLNFDPLAGDAGVDTGPIGSGGFTGASNAYFKASNPGRDDHFGTGLALSADGSTLAIGATGEDSAATGIDGDQLDNTVADAGAVYVLSVSPSNWNQDAYVKAPATVMGAQFGKALALSADGSTLAVGASEENNVTGRVYMFRRTAGTWAFEATVDATNPDPGDEFGDSVALSADGNTLAVGALGESSSASGINGNQADNTDTAAGATYVYTRAGSTWTPQAYIKSTPSVPGNGFGIRVALSADGNTLVGTADGEDSIQLDSGRALVFVRNGTAWSQQASLKASNPGDSDRMSQIALSASGDVLALGSPQEDSAATGIDGNQSDNSAVDSGAVYVFTRAGTLWSQQTYVKASNTVAGDRFGQRLSVSGDGMLLAVGAPNQASGAGAIYVYAFEDAVWSQRLYLKAPHTDTGDGLGIDLGFSQAGDALAVGAFFEDGRGTDPTDNSRSDSGAAYMFR